MYPDLNLHNMLRFCETSDETPGGGSSGKIPGGGGGDVEAKGGEEGNGDITGGDEGGM